PGVGCYSETSVRLSRLLLRPLPAVTSGSAVRGPGRHGKWAGELDAFYNNDPAGKIHAVFWPRGERPGVRDVPHPRAHRVISSGRQNRARLAFRHDPGVLLNLAVVAAQRPAAEQEATDDRAAGEDAGDPPERGVVAVGERLPEQ